MTIIKQFHVYFKHFDGCGRKQKIVSSSQQINNSSNVIFIALSIQPRNRNFFHSLLDVLGWYYLSYELFFHQFSCLMDCYIFTFYFHEIKTFPSIWLPFMVQKSLPFVLDFIFWGSFFRFFYFFLFFLLHDNFRCVFSSFCGFYGRSLKNNDFKQTISGTKKKFQS